MSASHGHWHGDSAVTRPAAGEGLKTHSGKAASDSELEEDDVQKQILLVASSGLGFLPTYRDDAMMAY
jgi:hypothetical protein